MKTLIKILFFVLAFQQGNAQITLENFTSSIEKKHNKEAFLQKNFISYDIDIKFGGNDYLKGTILQETGGGKIQITQENGSIIVFDGDKVYGKGVSDKKKGKARFDIFTWPYFIGMPYKLDDKGTVWSNASKNIWDKEKLATAKLSFESGTGDAPDDWYIVYKNEDNSLAGTAYIVSFGKGKEAAEKEPHAIKYNDYQTIEGIPISTNWSFHLWSIEEGYTETIGEVKLSNIKFLKEADIRVPEGTVIIENPNK